MPTLSKNVPDIGEVITAARGLVRYVKQAGLAAQLSKTVLQMGETRFSMVYLTLKSVQDIYTELQEKLETRGELELSGHFFGAILQHPERTGRR